MSMEESKRRELKMTTEKVKCPECPKEYFRTFLPNYIKSVHKKIKDHVCGECGSAFDTEQHLKAHVDGVHLNIKKVKCAKCGMACSTKQALGYHDKQFI